MTKTRILLIVLILLSSASSTIAQNNTFRIVGYYSLDAAIKEPRRSTLKKLTHVNLWFLNPDSAGNFTRNLEGLATFVSKAHRQKVKVLVSIGGGSKHPQYHTLLQDNRRKGLIHDLVSIVLTNNLDGIDVDLEGSDIDENYESFVVELAQQLRLNNKLITSAIAVYYKDQLSDKALATYDFVNVMSYDRTGPWRPEKPGPHSTYEHALEDLTYFSVERKIPREKMTLGVPFYGYGYGPQLTSKAISMNYGKIVDTFPGAETKDEWTMADGKILYYNGIPTIIRKTQLAGEMASGIMIWQVLGDARGSKSLLRAIYRNGRRK
jgi:GH18 family chitinase